MRKSILSLTMMVCCLLVSAADKFVTFMSGESNFALAKEGNVLNLVYDNDDYEGVKMALTNLQKDLNTVCGVTPLLGQQTTDKCVIVGSLKSQLIQQLIKSGKIKKTDLQGKNEKYLLQIIDNPIVGVSQALVIAGSDKRGTIYGIYELSRQIGVSPWYWWADVPARHQDNIYIKKGVYKRCIYRR